MNSKQLIKEFEPYYEAFFSDKPIVLSLPFCINRCGDISKSYTGISIKQKVPIKIYVGIRPTAKIGYHFGEVLYYDCCENEFKYARADEYLPYCETILQYIKEIETDFPIKDGGIELSFLCELPKGSGLGFDQLIFTLVMASLYVYGGKITSAELSYTENETIYERLEKKNENQLLKHIISLEKKVFGYSYNSGYVLSSYFHGGYPFAVYQHDVDKIENLLVSPMNSIFLNLPKAPDLFLDYGLIYSGKPASVFQIISNIAGDDMYLEKSVKTWENHLANSWQYYDQSNLKKLLHLFKEKEIENYLQTMASVNLGLFSIFCKIFSTGYAESSVEYFIYLLNKARYAACILRQTSSCLSTIINEIYAEFGFKGEALALNFNDTNVMGGCITFGMYSEGFEGIIKRAIKRLNDEMIPAVMIYANWQDGCQYEGLTLEQDISNHHIKELPSREITMKGGVSYEDIKKDQKYDILLNLVTMKLYIGGIKVTSKELVSQSMTVEILYLLYKSEGSWISNKKLPKSSYSTNKNEMIGKIIKPLAELVLDRTGKKLELVCEGSSSDFALKLSFSDSDIVLGTVSYVN